MNKGIVLSAVIAAINSFAINAATPETETTALSTFTSAEPIERAVPRYPRLAAKKGQEGWVRVSFVVDEAGNVKDPIVHDSSGIERFEKAALKAVADWKYSPAHVDGKPVEQCNSKVQLDFRLENHDKGVTRSFRRQYQALKKAILAGELQQADELFVEFKEESHHNYAETVHAAVVSAMYFDAKKATAELMRELEAVANNGYQYLGDEAYIAMVSKLLILQVQHNQISAVLELAEKVNSTVKPDTAGLQALNDIVAKVRLFIEESEHIVVHGKIEGNRAWHHQLLLNKFDIVSQGKAFERIEIRCKNKHSTYGGIKEQGFTIPEAWGQCNIYVDAPAGTEFSLVEYTS